MAAGRSADTGAFTRGSFMIAAVRIASVSLVPILLLAACGPVVPEGVDDLQPKETEVAPAAPDPDEELGTAEQQTHCTWQLTGCALGAVSVVAGAAVTVSCAAGTAVTTAGTLTASCYIPYALTGVGAYYTVMACSNMRDCFGNNHGRRQESFRRARRRPGVRGTSTSAATVRTW
jgi:hypothetical protein